jgi:diguanylate cyclase (GGDEF)-like protein/PAS domain S-box-containing protein
MRAETEHPVESTVTILNDVSGMFQLAFEHCTLGMALGFPAGNWHRVNHSLCEMLGYSEEELLASNFKDLIHPADLAMSMRQLEQLLRNKTPFSQIEIRCTHRGGHLVWTLWSLSPVFVETSADIQLIFQIEDITQRKTAEQRLVHDAFHDTLTGLPNRALMRDHLQQAFARGKRRLDYRFALLFLDVDRFKLVNDSLGHIIGDQLLVGIARRLEACVRPGDTVARVGGDEFTILLEDMVDDAEAIKVAERIHEQLKTAFHLAGRDLFTTVSIGIAAGSRGYEQPDQILRDADTAMYRSKSSGRARHETFDEEMHNHSKNVLEIETDLRNAHERGEFMIAYQPIVALDDFRVCGFEALVRWNHPERGLVSPIDFIPIAEEGGQIIQIGQWVLAGACHQLKTWQESFPPQNSLYVTVNLSPRQFAQPDLVAQVDKILKESGLNPECLKLEITEGVLMEDFESAAALLFELRKLGVRLSIDDFGTGYSSLTYLHRFPIDTLKIDRSFVIRMDKDNTEIVRTILSLAENLGMDVVAEGVETQEQMALLRDLNCQNGQGYFFAKPMSVDEAYRVIAETSTPTQARVA